MGVVSRDCVGKVLVSSWDYIASCKSVEEAELRASIAGLYICITLHSPIIIETGCASVAASFAEEGVDRSPLHDLKKEAWTISKLFTSLKVAKIRRSTNMVAHLLAKFSFDNRVDGTLVNDVLPCVVNSVMNDCNISVLLIYEMLV